VGNTYENFLESGQEHCLHKVIVFRGFRLIKLNNLNVQGKQLFIHHVLFLFSCICFEVKSSRKKDKKERQIKAQIYIYKTLNKYIFKNTISNKY